MKEIIEWYNQEKRFDKKMIQGWSLYAINA